MPSHALRTWHGERSERLAALYRAHRAVHGARPDALRTSEQVAWALVVRLAAEFQGFVRDLHEEAVQSIDASLGDRAALRSVLYAALDRGRLLTRGNATRGNIRADFERLGVDVVSAVVVRHREGRAWLAELDRLNDARNGVVHADFAKLRRAVGESRLGLARVRQWHQVLRALARALDRIVAETVAEISGGGPPW